LLFFFCFSKILKKKKKKKKKHSKINKYGKIKRSTAYCAINLFLNLSLYKQSVTKSLRK
jgi:hypothetical protein